MNVMNIIARSNMAMMPTIKPAQERRKTHRETVTFEGEGIDYNTIYRNHPGWYQKDSEALKKAYEAEQEKAAGRIQKIIKKAYTPNVREACDSYEKAGVRETISEHSSKKSLKEAESTDLYDNEGAKIRNEIREKMYGKNYKKAAI